MSMTTKEFGKILMAMAQEARKRQDQPSYPSINPSKTTICALTHVLVAGAEKH